MLSLFTRKAYSYDLDRPRRKPFTQWVKNLASLKNKESSGKKNATPKQKKGQTNNGPLKNNPYPKSGQNLQNRRSLDSGADGQLSFSQANGSYGSLPNSTTLEQSNGNRSGAPTLATKAETVHSDAGHSKAATTTTHGGALSSIDGVGADSTFSSPSQSQHSLTTTLTTIQSTGAGNTLQLASTNANAHHHGILNNPNPGVMFSHQYPVSPAPSTPGDRISAIPRHVADSMPNTYTSATANNLLSDDASVLTLASSSKQRRRRSMDTDASVRALAPSSVWGGSRESLPLSVLGGNADTSATPGGYYTSQSRPSIGGLASAERASVYSSQGVGLASERNSLISHRAPAKDMADAKSMRSITLGDKADARSLGGDVGSLRGYEGSVKSGRLGHSRNDSIPGSIGSPLVSPRPGQPGMGGLSRRSSDWAGVGEKDDDEDEDDGTTRHVEDEDEAKEGLEEQEVVRNSREEAPVIDGP